MSHKDKKIAVLGGGFGGLATLVMLQEEGFSNLVCFERTDQIGGTWCYREQSTIGVASIMPTTIINHSKEMGALSNFPPKRELPNYMKHSELYQYIKDYIAEHDVMKYVRLNHQVTACKRAVDYDETGRWTVTVLHTVSGVEVTDEYDAVVMCVGYNSHPKMASFPGLERFKGKVMHTHSLKWVSGFNGENVLVIGMGCSALDAAVGVSNVAKQVYLSTRSGSHVVSRVGPKGCPIDYVIMRRCFSKWLDILPVWVVGGMIRKFLLDPQFDQKNYPVEPKGHCFSKEPILNDHIFSKLMSGEVIQKRNVNHFTEDGVVFDSEDEETKIDSVIMATGYEWKFPFLEEGIVVQEDNGQINLYKQLWPSHLNHPTFAVLGFILTFGPGFPIGELQCRYVAHVLSGKGKLPSESVMMKDIKRRYTNNSLMYAPSHHMSIKVHCDQYGDELASLIGAKPNFLKLFFTDIRLFLKLVFGPFVSYQYRLEGPHKWDGARDAIMTVEDRMHFPLRKGKSGKSLERQEWSWTKMAKGWIILLIVFLGLSTFTK